MELDELQGSIASAREASARAAQDVARLRRENARLGASVVRLGCHPPSQSGTAAPGGVNNLQLTGGFLS